MTLELDPQDTALAAFGRAVARAADQPALHYFDFTMTYGELDCASSALALALTKRGFAPGDRLALFLQNVPHFMVALIAGWKAGAVVMPINPMNRVHELTVLFKDARPKALILAPDVHASAYAHLADDVPRPDILLSSSPWWGQTRNDSRVLGGGPLAVPAGFEDVQAVIEAHLRQPFTARRAQPADAALLLYTSGTTGVPKGVICTQNALALQGTIGRDSFKLTPERPMLAMAPLFHITGLAMNLCTVFDAAGAQILVYRFHPEVMIDAIAEHNPWTTTGATTAFLALMNSPAASPKIFKCFGLVRCGGAPVPPAMVERFTAMFGISPRSGYGLTEASGTATMVPLDQPDRVDAGSGALTVGVAVPGVTVRIVDDEGRDLPAGSIGEVVLRGPCISPGYWNRPDATAQTMRPDGLRTGDVGLLDADGWLYLVDRKKDMIAASGYKVWPREVEDMIYTHPAVREAAVVGVPDEYRGETVKAFVSLKNGQTLQPQELIDYCKERMAAYKYPRMVEILDDLPKTVSGKIQRAMLRK